jgi:hypothetical protein
MATASSDPSVILLNFCVKTGEFEVKIFAHVSGFEYPLSLLPVCYHGTARIILASTVTSRAQALKDSCKKAVIKTSAGV